MSRHNILAFWAGILLGTGILIPVIAFRAVKHKVTQVVDKAESNVTAEVIRVKKEIDKWREQRKANKPRK